MTLRDGKAIDGTAFYDMIGRTCSIHTRSSRDPTRRTSTPTWRNSFTALRVTPPTGRHDAQTIDDVHALEKKYQAPVFGKVRVWDLVERLSLCIDEMDPKLGLVSQLVHALQVVEGMSTDGIDDPDLLVTALIHDIGKLLLLTGEDPANLGGTTHLIGTFEEGVGLDRCVLQWSHDEFGYSRFKDAVPEHVAWLIRYHSIDVEECRPFMDERDSRLTEKYLTVFGRYDDPTKSMFRKPESRLEDYRDLIEDAFPEPILF